jgi:hypothetical protein
MQVMNLRSLRTSSAIAVFVAVAFSQRASALPSYSGTVVGEFSDPVLSGIFVDENRNYAFQDNTSTGVVSITNDPTSIFGSVISWGSPNPSSLLFQGAAFSGVAPGVEFKLGTMTYTNGSGSGTLTSLVLR